MQQVRIVQSLPRSSDLLHSSVMLMSEKKPMRIRNSHALFSFATCKCNCWLDLVQSAVDTKQ